MMLDFSGERGSKMTSNNWTLEDQNQLIVEESGGHCVFQ